MHAARDRPHDVRRVIVPAPERALKREALQEDRRRRRQSSPQWAWGRALHGAPSSALGSARRALTVFPQAYNEEENWGIARTRIPTLSGRCHGTRMLINALRSRLPSRPPADALVQHREGARHVRRHDGHLRADGHQVGAVRASLPSFSNLESRTSVRCWLSRGMT